MMDLLVKEGRMEELAEYFMLDKERAFMRTDAATRRTGRLIKVLLLLRLLLLRLLRLV
jgi:hypothetical protein